VDIGQLNRGLKKKADELGLPFGERSMTYNSRLAQELGKWAESKGRGKEFHHAAFRAYFVECKNIAEIEVLMGIAESAGLPCKEAELILTERTFKDMVDKDWAASGEKAIMAAPTFILNNDRLVGAQPHKTMEKLMDDNKVMRRKPLATE